MGFAQEMKDFVAAFDTTSRFGDRLSARRLNERRFGPAPEEEITGPGPFPDEGPTVPDTTKKRDKGEPAVETPPIEPAETETHEDPDTGVVTGSGSNNTLIGSGAGDTVTVKPSAWSNAIAVTESGGRYDAIGPMTKGDRPYGKHQVMGRNIPVWTKEVLGRSYTPQEWIKDPAAQERVFDAKFGQYVDQFGLEGAAQAWLGGPGSVGKGGRKDVLGTSVSSYGRQFLANLKKGGGGEAVQVASGAITDDQLEPDIELEPKREEEEPIQIGDGGGDGGDQGTEFGSESAVIPALEPVELAVGATPQVQGDWGDPYPGEEVLYAYEGGAIPDTQHFAPGGKVDPYNPNRSATYLPPTAPKSPTAPTTPATSSATTWSPYTGLTPSQQAWKDIRTERDKPPPAPPPPPPAPAAPAGRFKVTARQRSGGNDRGAAAYAHIHSPLGRGIEFSNWNELSPRIQNYLKKNPQHWQLSSVTEYNPVTGIPGYHYEGGMVGFEDGGVIPETAEEEVSFARGGKVNRAEFNRLVEQEELRHGIGGQGGTDSARDRVARRLNIQERGINSTAYTAANDPTQFVKPKEKKGGQKVDKEKTAATEQPYDPLSSIRAPKAAEQPYDPLSSIRAPARPAYDPLSSIRAPGSLTAEPAILVPGEEVPPINDAEVVPPEPPAPAIAAEPPAPAIAPSSSAEPAIPVPSETLQPLPPAPAQQPERTPAAAFDEARILLERGENPQSVLWNLRQVVPDDSLWPIELQNFLHGFSETPAFAEGGVVPEDEREIRVRESWHTGGATPPGTSYADPGTSTQQNQPDMQPTPELMQSVGEAVRGGLSYLRERYIGGGAQEGALPAPEDAGARQDGARRFAMGEGQATPEEIQGVDDKIDPQRQLREGDRQLARLANMTTWYLENGRGEDAKASAAALLQYGATRFNQLGNLAAVGYEKFLETGDQAELEKVLGYISQAYQMVPDGAQMEFAIDRESNRLVGTRTDADGNEVQFDLDPQAIGGMLAGLQDKSAYWKQIFSIADPAGARQKAGWEHEEYTHRRGRREKAADLEESRTYTEGYEERKHARTREEKAADLEEQRKHARTVLEEGREYTEGQEAEEETEERERTKVDQARVAPLRAAADKAMAEYNAAAAAEDPDATTAAKLKVDQAVSQLYDALPPDVNRDEYLKQMGYEPEMWDYVETGGTSSGNGMPPDAKQAPDGQWYRPDPARPGKYLKVSPNEAAATSAAGG